MDYLDFGYDGYLSKTGVIGYAYEPATQFDSKSDTSFITTTMVTNNVSGADIFKYRLANGARYFSAGITNQFSIGTAIVDQLWATPFITSKSIVIDRLSVQTDATAGAGNKARIGIYKDNGSVYPAGLLIDAGELDTTSASTLYEATVSITLEANTLYWLANIHNNSTNTFVVPANQAFSTILGNPAGSFDSLRAQYRIAQTYGALPSTYPASATLASNLAPVFLRIQRNA